MTALEYLAMWSQIGGAAIFVILAVVLFNRFMKPGVRAYTETKNAEIRELEEFREKMRRDLEAAKAELSRGDDDAREIRGRLEVVIKREREAALAAAQAEAARILRNAEGEHERARLAARDRLRIEFIEKALSRARTEAFGRIDESANRRLVETTVNDLTRGRA